MDRVFTVELARHIGERVRLAGWLHHQRALAHISFVLLRDGKGVAQIVVVAGDAREQLAGLLPETVIQVEGTVVESEQAPAGVELRDPSIDVQVEPEVAPPFELRRREIHAQLPTILDHAALSLRHPRRRAAFALAAASVAGFRATLDAAGFVEVHTPKIVAAATEGGANVFPVDWFGRPAFLAQSPQFYKQVMVGVFERVYEVAPVFRAEPHDTARHLAEYVSLASAHERWLGEWAAREHGSDFLYVSGYPMASAPSTRSPIPTDPRSRTVSTCSSAGWSS